jgi:hypothetical protein
VRGSGVRKKWACIDAAVPMLRCVEMEKAHLAWAAHRSGRRSAAAEAGVRRRKEEGGGAGAE